MYLKEYSSIYVCINVCILKNIVCTVSYSISVDRC